MVRRRIDRCPHPDPLICACGGPSEHPRDHGRRPTARERKRDRTRAIQRERRVRAWVSLPMVWQLDDITIANHGGAPMRVADAILNPGEGRAFRSYQERADGPVVWMALP